MLSISQASRMVGVRRSTLQNHIRDGRLMTFEGELSMSELLKLFPQADADKSGMVEKMERIKEGALYKPIGDSACDTESLLAEIHRLRLELNDSQARLTHFQRVTTELKDHLYDMQEQCDRNQKALLSALITWVVRKTRQ